MSTANLFLRFLYNRPIDVLLVLTMIQMNQSKIHDYLNKRDQLTSVHLFLSGYAPLHFVIRQGLYALLPIAMILGFSPDSLQDGSATQEQKTVEQKP